MKDRGNFKCDFFSYKYFRVKSILYSSNSLEVGFFNVDILNVVICCCEGTVLGTMRYLATLPKSLSRVD